MMKAVVVIATYNERDNISKLIDEILKLRQPLDIVVVDDNSPDRTWEKVQERGSRDERVHLVRRFSNKGRGSAGVDGFLHALKLGSDAVIEMDADFAHDPCYIPLFLDALKTSDVVIGSRFLPGGKDKRKNFYRRVLSRCAAFYIRTLLQLDIRDPASGYRCFKRDALQAILLDGIRATDPFVITETIYRCKLMGFSIKEIPIHFEDRNKGFSKLNLRILLRYLLRVVSLRFTSRLVASPPCSSRV
jgi:dolichol-phosphate mannosyltransferase